MGDWAEDEFEDEAANVLRDLMASCPPATSAATDSSNTNMAKEESIQIEKASDDASVAVPETERPQQIMTTTGERIIAATGNQNSLFAQLLHDAQNQTTTNSPGSGQSPTTEPAVPPTAPVSVPAAASFTEV